MDARVAAFADRLRTDPCMLAKGEELKTELLAHPDVRAWLGFVVGRGQAQHRRRPRRSDQRAPPAARSVADVTRPTAGGEPELQAKVDDWVMRAAGHVVDHYRGEVADLIAGTVAKWDGAATADRLELQVGRDLQFIRINGTIVGGLAGLVIYTVSQLLF